MASGGVARHEACRAGGRPGPAVFLPADPGPGIHRSSQATSGKPVWDSEEVTGAARRAGGSAATPHPRSRLKLLKCAYERSCRSQCQFAQQVTSPLGTARLTPQLIAVRGDLTGRAEVPTPGGGGVFRAGGDGAEQPTTGYRPHDRDPSPADRAGERQ